MSNNATLNPELAAQEARGADYVTRIEKILEETLPEGAWKLVVLRKNAISRGHYIKIAFAANDHAINDVKGQFPQSVSLSLGVETLELEPQCFGGVGGRTIYLIPDKNHPRERFLAMAGVDVPFRKPKKTEKAVFSAVERFASRWVETLKEHRDRLHYQKHVDYDKLLS